MGGNTRNSLVGMCYPNPDDPRFQTNTCHFPSLFLDLAFKIHTNFQS